MIPWDASTFQQYYRIMMKAKCDWKVRERTKHVKWPPSTLLEWTTWVGTHTNTHNICTLLLYSVLRKIQLCNNGWLLTQCVWLWTCKPPLFNTRDRSRSYRCMYCISRMWKQRTWCKMWENMKWSKGGRRKGLNRRREEQRGKEDEKWRRWGELRWWGEEGEIIGERSQWENGATGVEAMAASTSCITNRLLLIGQIL